MDRRKMLLLSGTMVGSASAIKLSGKTNSENQLLPVKVLVAGAHPDDPESGCGGFIARLTSLGHQVSALYLTKGEAGIDGKSFTEAASIRTLEAEEASRILGCKSIFAGQTDGQTEINRQWFETIDQILSKENPDIIVTHWPIDTHRDHRVASNLVYDAWLKQGKKATLLFYEVMRGHQSQNFNPNLYVDISDYEEVKRKACYAHVSQNPGEFYNIHEKMHEFRGLESGCRLAEAYVKHEQSPFPERLRDLFL